MSNHKSIESAIKNLEIQVGHLAKQIVENSSRGFGANTEKNPKEECKAVMTRSKKETMMEMKVGLVMRRRKEAPYPLVPSKKDKERHFAHFLDIFKKLEITIPFGKALQQMPLYSKFLNDLLTKKGKYIHSDDIMVEGNCSAVIQRILPLKYKDPGSVTIPCSIGVVSDGKALIDLGASINLMPLSMCRRIGELEIMPTRTTLRLADRSIIRPYGVVEDVLVKVHQFTFLADFVIMDIEEDTGIPLILGRPFMLTANCVVDMGKGNLEMSVDDQMVRFDLFDAVKHSIDWNVYSKMDEIENEIAQMARAKISQDP
ncbi:uncharacterized protein LOC114397132 [Glycine soja]|uniref:uncharacterized protein LOC114397132 n=1 Tax=Glycine soja TaxID=3848 RepID=UPI00103E549F|nr:uncharacterized protein LOC114397132 [Glycine soja]